MNPDIIDIVTSADALDWISNNSHTLADLEQLASQMEASGGSSGTLFYSGSIDTNLGAWQVAESIGHQSGGTIGTFDQTEAGKLFNDIEFRIALENAGVSSSNLNDVLNDFRADASRRLADNVSGAVKTITGFAGDESVFTTVELPALLNNTDVTTIDGIARADLLQLYNNEGGNSAALLKIRDTLAAKALVDTADLELPKNLSGEYILDANGKYLSEVGTHSNYLSDFSGATPHTLDISVPASAPASAAYGHVLDENAIISIGKGAKILGTSLGIAGDAYSFLAAYGEATEQWNADQKADAAETMSKWAGDFVAGTYVALEVGAFVANTPLIKGLAAFGAPGKVMAAILVGGFALAGGIVGGETAQEAIDKIFDLGKSLGLILDDSLEEMGNALQTLIGQDAENPVSSLYNAILAQFTAVQTLRDPLILDLNGDGFAVMDTSLAVYWSPNPEAPDMARLTEEWMSPEDGFLVWDANVNGKIEDLSETFGVSYFSAWEDLAQYDDNADGVPRREARSIAQRAAHLKENAANDNFKVWECVTLRCRIAA